MQRTRLLIALFLLLVGLAALLQAVLPLRSRALAARAALDDTTAKLEHAKSRKAALDAAEAEIKKRGRDFLKLDRLVPLGEQRENIAAMVHQIANESRVEIQSLRIDTLQGAKEDEDDEAATPREQQRALTVALNGRTRYGEWKTFLNSLETQVRLASVKSIEIGPENDKSDILQFAITFEVYYQ